MILVNCLLLLFVVAGHAKLVVEGLNRLHARPLPERILKQTRHAHDVLLLVFPVALFVFVGVTGPRLLRGGTWTDVSAPLWGAFGVCWLGAGWLAFSALRWGLHRPPKWQVACDSRVVDVAERLGRRPLAAGPYRWLAGFPGNELFEVEVVERTLVLPRLPETWDGISILHLTDLHYIGTIERAYFDVLMDVSREMDPDLVVLTGDVVDDLRLLEWIPATLGTLSAPLGRYFILGNHDWRDRPDDVRAAMQDLGWTDVGSRAVAVEFAGARIALGGDERPWLGTAPDFASVLDTDLRLLLSHTPDNVRWAREHDVDLVLSGHTHGGQVVLPFLGPIYSPSAHGARYASGLFWEPPTLLVVSRGLSGEHPVRVNCRPELSKLVLRTSAALTEADAREDARESVASAHGGSR